MASVGTLPRTARHLRLCGAFCYRLALYLAFLLPEALSPRVGGVSCRLWALKR